MSIVLQDSLPIHIDGERIPSVVPVTPEPPKPRAAKRRLQDARSHGVPEVKRCRSCSIVKPSSEFNLAKKSRDGLDFRCAECTRNWVNSRYRKSTPDEILRRKERHIKRTYGLTLADFETMLANQGGGCAICASADHGGKSWHVDHDHETGAVRGILCHGCNHALGGARDNPDVLIAAAKYLWKRGK